VKDVPRRAHIALIDVMARYREHDLLPSGAECVIAAASSLHDTVKKIMCESGLEGGAQAADGALTRYYPLVERTAASILPV
jgi:hypothetical protein